MYISFTLEGFFLPQINSVLMLNFTWSIKFLIIGSGSETDVPAVKWLKGNLACGECVENISFSSTVFLELLDCTQFVRVLSNLELEELVTVFLLFSVFSWSVSRAIRGLVLSFQIKIKDRWQEEEQLFLEVVL